MKIVTIVGARPQLIKASAFIHAVKKSADTMIHHTLIHTGQHHDKMMSDVFIRDLELGSPDFNLRINGGTHGEMTGRMLVEIEKKLINIKPEWVVVYGDTNSTLAAVLAASKLRIKIAHIEAGLRSFNMWMPEEINRIVADRLSTLLFCPTEKAVENLQMEGVTKGVSLVGDVMYDVSNRFAEIASVNSNILSRLNLNEKKYVLVTCHREENADNEERLYSILSAIKKISKMHTVVFPMHPRTRHSTKKYGLEYLLKGIMIIDPLSYMDMIMLEKNSYAIITDSGGVQKEAFFYKVPCITLRDETEWVETLATGWNKLVGANETNIIDGFYGIKDRIPVDCELYGDGNASEIILKKILAHPRTY